MKIKMTQSNNSRKQDSKRLSCKTLRKESKALRDMKRGGKRALWSVEA